MKIDQLRKIEIPDSQRRARGLSAGLIFGGVLAVLAVAAFFAWPRASDSQRIVNTTTSAQTSGQPTPVPAATVPPERPLAATQETTSPGSVVLTTSGYIINRERIEIGPRFVGIVKWMGVRKGDTVRRNQVIALLDDEELKAQLAAAEGRLARAKSALDIARLRHERRVKLRVQRVESVEEEDLARSEVEAATADLRAAQGDYAVARTQLGWTIIRSPIDGVVLEKLADENELVTPQSFGGETGPSTALFAIADMKDLQVDIDLNESELARVSLNQPCLISPEAYPDRTYRGHVAEIAPEANRSKGTLQVKVQIDDPDRFLIPELSAKVDFLATPEP